MYCMRIVLYWIGLRPRFAAVRRESPQVAAKKTFSRWAGPYFNYDPFRLLLPDASQTEGTAAQNFKGVPTNGHEDFKAAVLAGLISPILGRLSPALPNVAALRPLGCVTFHDVPDQWVCPCAPFQGIPEIRQRRAGGRSRIASGAGFPADVEKGP